MKITLKYIVQICSEKEVCFPTKNAYTTKLFHLNFLLSCIGMFKNNLSLEHSSCQEQKKGAQPPLIKHLMS